MPSLSPDGQRLAFVYRGDIWVASAEGGRATLLTQHLETDAYPVFSPDGQWIAFASKRTGNWDIFLVPAEGGPARQVTFHGGSDIASSWSPNSQRLFFSGKRDTTEYSLYSVEIASLRTHRLAEDYSPMAAPACSPRWPDDRLRTLRVFLDPSALRRVGGGPNLALHGHQWRPTAPDR